MRAAGSVQEVVRDIMSRNRAVLDCMKMEIINYTALAARMQPEIEQRLGTPVNLNTVVVAVKRYSDSLKAEAEPWDGAVMRDARLTLTDGMVDIRISADGDAAGLLDRFSQVSADHEVFGVPGALRILAEDLDAVRRLADSLGEFSSGLAKINIAVPPGSNGAGVASFVAEELRAAGVELVDAHFTRERIVIILDESDASRAYEALRTSIARPDPTSAQGV